MRKNNRFRYRPKRRSSQITETLASAVIPVAMEAASIALEKWASKKQSNETDDSPMKKRGSAKRKSSEFPLGVKQNEKLQATVLTVHDGDGLKVRDDNGSFHEIRLYAIDAPERDQPYGKKSKEHLESISGARVALYPRHMDQYGRIVCVAYNKKRTPLSLNLAMIKEGMAYYDPKYGTLQGAEDFQDEAHQHKRGLWAWEGKRQSPWEKKHAGQSTNRVTKDDDAVTIKLPSASRLMRDAKRHLRKARPQNWRERSPF